MRRKTNFKGSVSLELFDITTTNAMFSGQRFAIHVIFYRWKTSYYYFLSVVFSVFFKGFSSILHFISIFLVLFSFFLVVLVGSPNL